MWLGLDDTDSPKGGCTTWVMTEVLREVAEREVDIDLIGFPRLVRLNPNVPFKTRGNAALAARFGRGEGKASAIGSTGDAPLRAYPRGRPLSEAAADRLWARALDVLGRHAQWGERGTDPAAVLSPRPLPEELYLRAVREEVRPSQALEVIAGVQGTRVAAFGSGEGVVGASAALAWRGRRRTYEVIAYRPRERWGRPRRVDPSSVREMAQRHPESFLSYDDRTRRTLIVPHTPCPILFGVRARTPAPLLEAVREVRSEPWERWVVFRTNQATGDHLVARTVAAARGGLSGVFEGQVAGEPHELRGGHVEVPIADATGELGCVAFEPTKTLPPVVRALLPGDTVRVWGSFAWPGDAASPRTTLRLEGISVLRARPRWEKLGNPVCPSCRTRTDSRGRGKGYRCPRCRRRFPPEAAPGAWRSRARLRGTYLPTPSARRHLSPLGAPRPVGPSHL